MLFTAFGSMAARAQNYNSAPTAIAPTHGRCNSTDKRARSRRATCRSPDLSAARVAATPILWSQAAVQSQTKFVNENPFDARPAFARYLAQLPETGSFSGSKMVRRHWNGACDKPACASCAVVGASGTLLKRKDGEFIDSHSVVLRPNWLKIKGYERHTGQRTTLNIIFALENMVDQFIRAQRKLPRVRRAIGLVTPSSKRSLNSHFRYLGRIKTNTTHGLHKPLHDDAPLFLLSDSMWMLATNLLCDATGGGCEWPSRSSTMRPSSGFYAVLVALQACANVSLFGLTSDPCQPFHYYGPEKTTCTLAVPKENDEHVHWFEKEHELYAQWAQQGRLRVFS